MKKLLFLIATASLSIAPIISSFNLLYFESELENDKTPNNLNVAETNHSKNKANNLVDYLYFDLETWAIGHAWGTGKAKKLLIEDEMSINLDKFGGQYLLQHYYKGINLEINGEYYFQNEKKFNWNDYHKEKIKYTADRTFYWDTRENMSEWVLLKHAESQEGGYKWGNYYKAWVKTEFKTGKLILNLKYELAAYGVGSNWYWSAGKVSSTKINYIAR